MVSKGLRHKVVPRWWKLAKSELQIRTSKLRTWRKSLFIIVPVILAAYAYYLFPVVKIIVFLMGSEITPLVNMNTFLKIIILFVFLMIFMTPLTQVLEDLQVAQIELILSTPATSSDMIIGDFVGTSILYSPIIAGIIVTVDAIIYGFFTVNVLQLILLDLAIVAVLLLSLWIGILLAAGLRSRLGGSQRGRYIGQAIMFFVGFAFLPLIYGYAFVEFWLQTSPVFNFLFELLPSTWAANGMLIILGISQNLPLVLVDILCFSLFSLVTGWMGIRKAESLYLMVESSTIKKKKYYKPNPIYTFLRNRLPPQLGATTVSVMREFIRNPENIAQMGIFIAMGVVMVFTPALGFGFSEGPFENPTILLFFTLWIFLFTQAIFASTLTGMSISVGHKDKLWLYRKAPNGIDIYLRARVLQFFVMFLPITSIAVIIGFYFVNNAGLMITLLGMALSCFYVIASIALGVGVFALNPVHERRGPKVALNMFAIMIIQMPVLMGGMLIPIFTLFEGSPIGLDLNTISGIVNFATILGLPVVPLIVVSTLVMFIGARSLNNRED